MNPENLLLSRLLAAEGVDVGAKEVVGAGANEDVVGAGANEVVGAGANEVVGAGANEDVGAGANEVVGAGANEDDGAGAKEDRDACLGVLELEYVMGVNVDMNVSGAGLTSEDVKSTESCCFSSVVLVPVLRPWSLTTYVGRHSFESESPHCRNRLMMNESYPTSLPTRTNASVSCRIPMLHPGTLNSFVRSVAMMTRTSFTSAYKSCGVNLKSMSDVPR